MLRTTNFVILWRKQFLRRTAATIVTWSLVCGTLGSIAVTKTDSQTKTAAQIVSSPKLAKNIREKPESYSASSYQVPPGFEPNLGQMDPKAKFRSLGLGYNVFLTENDVVAVFSKPTGTKKSDNKKFFDKKNKLPPKYRSSVLRMSFVGANQTPTISTLNEQPGKRNYLTNEKKALSVPNYGGVVYKNIYDGVNVDFCANEKSLEYSFRIEPKQKVSTIKLKFEGASGIVIDSSGDLVLTVGGEKIRHKKPVIYQEISGAKSMVEGGYILDKKNEIGFSVKDYDDTKPLIIDPILSFSTYLGGSVFDIFHGMTVDKDGNAFLTGTTNSPNFPAPSGTLTGGAPSEANNQVFVSKFNAKGELVFSTVWGGDDSDVGWDINVDAAGNTYIAGITASSNYPLTAVPFQNTNHGSYDAFATKLNPAGTAFVYSTFLGGSDMEENVSSSLDSSGRFYVAGTTKSNDFPPPIAGAIHQIGPTATGNGERGFIARFNAAGSDLEYFDYISGSVGAAITDIAVDTDGNAFVTGVAASSDFPVTNGAFQTAYHDDAGFILKLNSSGSALIYSTFLEGTGPTPPTGFGIIWAIAVDATGNAYVTGETYVNDFPTTPGAYQSTAGGGSTRAFVTKLNPAGSAQVYSTYFYGNIAESGSGISIDSDGNAFVVGETLSSSLPTTDGALQKTLNGPSDNFVVKFNPTGTSLLYLTYLGGSAEDGASPKVQVTNCGDLYLAGSTTSFDFPTRQAYQPTNRSNPDTTQETFLTKLAFPTTSGTAPDASATGPLPVATPKEYKLPAAVDTEVIDFNYDDPRLGPQPLKVELWGSIYRPTTLTGTYPLILLLHGNHAVCERNSVPDPDPRPDELKNRFLDNWYAKTGVCDDPTTDLDESIYYGVVQNHRGYDYLASKLASWGYIVISINVNRGIHIKDNEEPFLYPDSSLILPRAKMVLRHLQKLSEWNSCTTDPACQTPSELGVDLRGKIDFSNVGLLGHSRGGQGVRAAYNLYNQASSVWQSRIPGLSIKGVFEIAPTDEETLVRRIPNPASRYIITGAKWNILLSMCDSDLSAFPGMHAYDRMLLALPDSPQSQDSTYMVWGADHNFYNTVWNFHDLGIDAISGDHRCVGHDPLWAQNDTVSEKQKQIAVSSVLAFFRGNLGPSSDANFNKLFNARYDPPPGVSILARTEKNFTPNPGSSHTTVFEDFSNSPNSDGCSTGSNTCSIESPSSVSTAITNIPTYHDQSLKVLNVNWTAPGSDKSIQINWRPEGSSSDISNYQTFDFRISRKEAAPNVSGATNFSIQLVMGNGTLSSPVRLCNYGYVDGPVGGYELVVINGVATGITPKQRSALQTIQIPLAAFLNVNLSQIRGIKFTFDESKIGSIYLANVRFTK